MRENNVFIKLVVFSLEQTNYAVVADNVLEIVDGGKLTAVPNINPLVEGAYNFKSRIIPVFNLKKMAGLDGEIDRENYQLIIVAYEDRLVGFMVDKIIDVFHLASLQVKTVVLKNFHSGIEGIGEINSTVFFLLSIEKMIAADKPFEIETQNYIIKEYEEAKKK